MTVGTESKCFLNLTALGTGVREGIMNRIVVAGLNELEKFCISANTFGTLPASTAASPEYEKLQVSNRFTSHLSYRIFIALWNT